MNKHFTKNHTIITGTVSTEPINAEKKWMGLIPHSDMVVEEITIVALPAKLTAVTTPTAADYVKDIIPGAPFLCEITQIKLSAGGCKMINPS